MENNQQIPNKETTEIQPIQRVLIKNKNYKIEVEISNKKPTEDTLKKAIIYDKEKKSIYEQDGDNKSLKNTKKDDDKLTFDDVYDRAQSYYQNLLKYQYGEIENLVILCGAGASVGIGQSNKGLTMAGLWDELWKEHQKEFTKIIEATHKDWLNENGELKDGSYVKDLEKLLSEAAMVKNVQALDKQHQIVEEVKLDASATKPPVVAVPPAAEAKKDDVLSLEEAINTAKSFIAEVLSLEQPHANSPHKAFLNKVMLRPQKNSRVKLFTTNYDTLFEQAARDEMFTIIDGFTFSSPRVFNGKYFDYDIIETRHNRQDKKDNIIPKLFYLYKMHGSLNWKYEDGRIIQTNDEKIENVNDRIMIFPQDSKYEHSYEQPYFEMMSRFQQSLRMENTLLITIGFSFLDKHISSVILESLKQNPSLNLMTFTYPNIIESSTEHQKELHAVCDIQSRVTMVADKFESLANNYPENVAQTKSDILEELNKALQNNRYDSTK